MREDQDPIIGRLFAQHDQNLPPEDFVPKVVRRTEEQKRVRRVYRIGTVTVCLVLLALSAPWVAQVTSMLIELTAAGVSTIGPLLYIPLTWWVVSATAVGCSPVIYLWRTGRW
jgi:hypothetical protein